MQADQARADRSVPRRRIRRGDQTHDGRGRLRATPAILHYGFRPFFLLAALHAALSVPLWLWMYMSGMGVAGPFSGLQWHAHEMVFGYLAAVIAGFVLTAVPNWTGRLPLSGAPLAGLVALWLAGRIACAVVTAPLGAAILDLAFPLVLAAAVWREVIAGRNWKNVPVAAILTLFASASLLHHLEAAGYLDYGFAMRMALATVAMLVTLIGGRIVPSFTRNWLVRQGETKLPASFGMVDKLALAATVSALLVWVFWPHIAATGWMLVASGSLLAARLIRWRGLRVFAEPIVLILHLGYAWLAFALVLLGIAALSPDLVDQGTALHALMAGAIATMTLAVMTRASLGHTGRDIKADGWTQAIYASVSVGAILRVGAAWAGEFYLPMLVAGGAFWSTAYAIFVLRYGPILCRPRA